MSMNRYFDPFVPRQHLEHGYGQDPADFDMRTTPFHTPHRLFGKGFDAMFPSGAATRSSLWAGRAHFPDRRGDLIGPQVVGAMRGLARLEDVDPRWLMMSQPAVTAAGVRYYMQEPDYARNGVTYADRYKPANAFPLIYQRAAGERVILAGHHRSAAALALGRPVRALVVRDDDETVLHGAQSSAPGAGRIVSEQLRIGGVPAEADGAVVCGSVEQAVEVIAAGGVAVVPAVEAARAVLVRNGAPEDWADYASSGRGVGDRVLPKT